MPYLQSEQIRQPRLPSRGGSRTNTWLAAAAMLAAGAIVGPAGDEVALGQPVFPQVNAPANPGTDATQGKENNQNVFVRDSAIAQEKFENAKKMERQKQWNNAASFYQEVLEKYAGRVVPAGVDKDGVIVQYTSITNGVRDRLCHWPADALEVYRGINEPKAAALLEKAQKARAAGDDDSFALHEILRMYFVTESGKIAALRLIDEKLERGEFSAAAWLGDDLLNMHPNLLAERPAVLFRTALAYHLAGNQKLAGERAATLTAKFPNEVGVVRGKDAVLVTALAAEMAQSPVTAAAASNDSWPMPGGDLQRDLVPTAHGSAGTRLAEIPLAKPDYKNLQQQQKVMLTQQIEAGGPSGMSLGVLPVADRGELFFQDGQRVYAVSLESGVPLTGWARTYGAERQGQYILPNVWGSARSHQQTLTLTDRQVLAVMGQPDYAGMQFGIQVQGETRLVCLDRESGKENWVSAPSTVLDVPKNEDEKAVRSLQLSGAPLVVGDNVLVIGRSNKQGQGEDCYVLAFDLANGHYRWGCYIASSGMTTNMMWGGMPQVTGGTDNTSHLAYANGRVYVLSNLGAVAALDAYSGTIVWLDIYPTDRPSVNPGMMRGFNPMMPQGTMAASKLKPWMYNPIVVHESKLFVLPTEGSNLLIYDAGTGREEKRIKLDQLANWSMKGGEQVDKPTTLVGISGDRLVLAGESHVLCLNWRAYDEEKFPGANEEMIFWPSFAPDKIRGRCFMTSDSVFVPGGERLRRLDIKTGSAVEEYPRYPRTWEDGESPGNVLVSGDHVVVAGATSVDLYTDLGMATHKLDREIAASPKDPEARLRYAEVLFGAGRGDEALAKMDEAINLMGGLDAIAAASGLGATRDRLFNDALTFATKSIVDERPETREHITQFYDRAAKSAASAQQQVNYRMARARFADSGHDPAMAVKLYQEILHEPQMRAVSMPDDEQGIPAQAEDAAEKAIAVLVRANGPEIYVPYKEAAVRDMAEAQADKDHPEQTAQKLLDVAQDYPNSDVAPRAMLAAADAYEQAGQPRPAIRVLRQMWFKYAQPESASGSALLASRVQIAESMARNYLAVADRNRPDMVTTAAARLAQAAQLPGDPKLSRDLKLPDGKIIAAGTTFARALEEVRAIHGKETDKALPDFHLPQPPTPAQKADGAKYPLPFAGQKKRDQLAADVATVLPGVSVLVAPAPDFARADRVVGWGGGVVSLFTAGQAQPLATIKTFPDAGHGDADAPRGVAWIGDTALVWNSDRVESIDFAGSRIAWQIDLTKLGTLEVVRINDGTTAAPMAENIAINGVIMNNAIRRRMLIRGGQVVINGNVVQVQGNVAVAAAGPGAPPRPVMMMEQSM